MGGEALDYLDMHFVSFQVSHQVVGAGASHVKEGLRTDDFEPAQLAYSVRDIAMFGVRCTGAAPLIFICVRLVPGAYVQIAMGLVPCMRVNV
jgi:hypothetical protein